MGKWDKYKVTPAVNNVGKWDKYKVSSETTQNYPIGSTSMLPSTDSVKPKLEWTPPQDETQTINKWDIYKTKDKRSGYTKFVDMLSKIQAGERAVVRETIEAVHDPSKNYEPLKRFKNALKGNEFVTASDVFKELDPKTSSAIANVLIGTAQGTAEVFLDMLTDPTAPILGAIGKAGGAAYKGISNIPAVKSGAIKALQKFNESPAGKIYTAWFTSHRGRPEAYMEAKDVAEKGIQTGRELAEETGNLLYKGLDRAKQIRAGQILKGGVSISERELPLREIAGKARQTITEVGKGAVEQNLLSEKTFIENMQTYSPRLYRKWEQSKKPVFEYFNLKPTKIGGQRFLKKTEIPANIRAEMGEILEPAYPVAKGIAQVTHDTEISKLFNKVSTNPEWSKLAEEVEQSPELLKNYVKLNPSKKLGDLSGKYVLKPIADDINDITKMPSSNELVRTLSSLYDKYISTWKMTKTVLNPTTHMRNIMYNTILLDQSGVDHAMQLQLLPKAAKDFLKNGKYYQEAKQANLLGKEYYGGEIKSFLENWNKIPDNMWEKIVNAGRAGIDKTGKIYQAEEQIFKLAKFIHSRESGMGIKEAAKEAEKYLFNYEKVPKFIEYARKSPIGSPFVTFASKAIPLAVETSVKNPVKMYKYVAFMKAIENQSKEKLGITQEDIDTIKRNRRGVNMVLPFKDNNGDYQTLDLSYVLAWGDIAESGGLFGISPTFTPSMPLTKAAIELGMNKSLYFDQPIWKKSDLPEEKASKIANYLVKNAVPLPTWAPGGYTWDKIVKSIGTYNPKTKRWEPRSDYWGRQRGVPKVLLDTLMGVKISPIDLGLIKRGEIAEQKELEREINLDFNTKMKNQGLTKEEKDKAKKIYAEKLKRLYNDRNDINKSLRLLFGGSIP